MRALIARDPRFVETKYYLGSYDVSLLISGQDKLDEADHLFDEAYAWRPEWPALTQSIANIAMTVEEFERAALFYDRTLALEPHAVDALLGKARALTYLGQGVEAIATLDTLLAERWFVGDARYWRALNESELERNDEAWSDIELAAKLLVNAEVPKLAGLIAYRRHELEVSREKFDQSRTRNPRDCETGYLPWRRPRRAARLASHGRGAARSVRLPAGGRARLHAGDRQHSRVGRSAGAQGEENRQARAVHREGAPLSGDVVVRHCRRLLQSVEAGGSAAVRREGGRGRAVRRSREGNPLAAGQKPRTLSARP